MISTDRQPASWAIVPPRVADFLTTGENRKTGQTNINSNPAVILRKRFASQFNTEAGKPMPCFALDGNCFYPAFLGPVQFNFDLTSALNIEFPGSQQLAPIPVRRECDAVVTGRRLVTGKPRFTPTPYSGIETLVGFVDPTQHVLAAGEIHQPDQALGPHLLQLVRLVVVVERLAANIPCPIPLLLGRVVKRAGLAQLGFEKPHLHFARVQTIFVGKAHLPPLLGLNIFTHDRVTDRPYRTGVVTAAPQRWQARLQKRSLLFCA
jgi:hypothetical protein